MSNQLVLYQRQPRTRTARKQPEIKHEYGDRLFKAVVYSTGETVIYITEDTPYELASNLLKRLRAERFDHLTPKVRAAVVAHLTSPLIRYYSRRWYGVIGDYFDWNRRCPPFPPLQQLNNDLLLIAFETLWTYPHVQSLLTGAGHTSWLGIDSTEHNHPQDCVEEDMTHLENFWGWAISLLYYISVYSMCGPINIAGGLHRRWNAGLLRGEQIWLVERVIRGLMSEVNTLVQCSYEFWTKLQASPEFVSYSGTALFGMAFRSIGKISEKAITQTTTVMIQFTDDRFRSHRLELLLCRYIAEEGVDWEVVRGLKKVQQMRDEIEEQLALPPLRPCGSLGWTVEKQTRFDEWQAKTRREISNSEGPEHSSSTFPWYLK